MRFICLGYFDEDQWNTLDKTRQQALMEECFQYDDELRRGGHFAGGMALGPKTESVTLRSRNGSVGVTDGPFSETKETLGGILYLEARDLNHAIALMSKHPGVHTGPFEIRPADEQVNTLIEARNKNF